MNADFTPSQFDRQQGFNGQQPGYEPYVPARPKAQRSRKHIWFGLGGLLIGVIVGVGLVGGIVGINAAFESSAEAEKAKLIPDAYESCSLENVEGAFLSADQLSVEFTGAGTYTGPNIADVYCFGSAIGMPDSVASRMGQTRALDGTQSAEWDTFSVSWNYHPDDGMGAVFEYVPEP